MVPPLSHRVAGCVETASQLYHRLVILAGPPRSGKTRAFRTLHGSMAWPMVNINLALSERLLELTSRQRALRAARLVDDIVRETAGEIVLLDNIEMLFHSCSTTSRCSFIRS
jgi:chloramphenicol 3-O-phosphotransferase